MEDKCESAEESTSSCIDDRRVGLFLQSDSTESTDDGSGADGVSNSGVGVAGDTLKASSLESKPDVYGHMAPVTILKIAWPVGRPERSGWRRVWILRPGLTPQTLWSHPTVSRLQMSRRVPTWKSAEKWQSREASISDKAVAGPRSLRFPTVRHGIVLLSGKTPAGQVIHETGGLQQVRIPSVA